MFAWLKKLFAGSTSKASVSISAKNSAQPAKSQRPAISPMNEGDYHSGPHGYSANTAYPNTEYGGGYSGANDSEHG